MTIQRRVFLILCLQGFGIAFNVASVSAIVPAIAGDFGLSAFVVGRVNWAYMLPYGLFALVYGPLTRRFTNRQIGTVSLSLFALFSILSGLAWDYRSLFVFRFLVGIVAAATTPLALIYISDHAPAAQRGKFVGMYFSATFVADLLGLIFSGVVAWRVMFFIPALLGVIAAVVTARYFPVTKTEKGAVSNRYWAALAQPEIFRVFAYIFLVSLLYHGVRQWLGVYFAQDRGWGQLWVSLSLTLISLAGVFGEFAGGLLSDRWGRVPTVVIGVAFMAFSVGALLAFKTIGVIMVLMLIWGGGWTLSHAGLSTHLTDLNKTYMKEVSSLNSSVRFISGAAGVALGGVVMERSFSAGFWIYGMSLLAMAFVAPRILRFARP